MGKMLFKRASYFPSSVCARVSRGEIKPYSTPRSLAWALQPWPQTGGPHVCVRCACTGTVCTQHCTGALRSHTGPRARRVASKACFTL